MDVRRLSVCLGVVVRLFCVQSEDNISFGSTAKQSSDESSGWKANAAVDGCLKQHIGSGCCSHTYDTGWKEAWWQVDLGGLSTVSYITIYDRVEDGYDYRSRFAGYQLFLSNTTDWTQGVLCYEDRSNTTEELDTVVTHQCPYVAQYVTVYNYRNNTTRHDWYDNNAVLELCEVQVFGCPIEKHGNGTCNNTCSDNCYGGNCDASTGSCFYCPSRKHGKMCDLDCSSNCEDRLCDKDTGYCKACITGTYGDFCSNNCPNNCLDNTCEIKNGQCKGCTSGKYGANCDLDCSEHCNNSVCMQINGQCKECVAAKYGSKCEQKCPPDCKDNICSINEGKCLHCITGRYGETCTFTCPVTCKDFMCDQQTGQCLDCYPGKYGVVCGADCPVTCQDNICNKDNGECLTIDCSTGRYGDTCTFTCPVTCKDFMCDKQTGQCLDCYHGKYGVVCGADCPVTCQDNICNKDDGECLTIVSTEDGTDYKLIAIALLTVICGLMLAVLITLVVCLIRKNKDKNDSSDKNIEQRSEDLNYSSLSGVQEETPNVYEMIVS